MMNRTFLLSILSALAATALIALTGCGGDGEASTRGEQAYTARVSHVEVEVATAQRQALSSDVQFTGSLLPRRYTRLVAEVDGVVRDVPTVGETFNVEHQGRVYSEQLSITFGQAVKQGDVLLELDKRDFQIALLMAEAKLTKAEAELANLMAWQRPEEVRHLTALRDEAHAKHERAKADLNRIEPLVGRNVVTKSEYEQARADVLTSKAVLEATQAKLTTAGAGPTTPEIAIQKALVAQAEAEVQQKQWDIEKATIRAPYDGVVTAFNVEVGDRVTAANGPVIEMMDLRYLIAEVGVPEAYADSIRVKDQATVRVTGEVTPVPGLVVAINELVDAQTRTFRVRVAIDNLQRRFKAGQFAEVELAMSAGSADVLAVPTRSIIFLEGQPHVFLVDDGAAKLAAIQIGLSGETNTEVLSGLDAGAVIVTDDPTLLSDGMSVSVRSSTPAPLAESGVADVPTS